MTDLHNVIYLGLYAFSYKLVFHVTLTKLDLMLRIVKANSPRNRITSRVHNCFRDFLKTEEFRIFQLLSHKAKHLVIIQLYGPLFIIIVRIII